MRKLLVSVLLLLFLPTGCSRTVDVNPPQNEEQSPAVAPENTSAEAETVSPFGNEPAVAPAE